MKPDYNEQESISHMDLLPKVLESDLKALIKAEKNYGSSWKKRGGVGAFMMLARKWDRLELQVKNCNWDIFIAHAIDNRDEGIIDDIRDLRRYLLLVEAQIESTLEKNQDKDPTLGYGAGHKESIPFLHASKDSDGMKNPFGYTPEEEEEKKA